MKEEILQAIKDFYKIVIHRHVRPDPDAIGSQSGLAEIIKASFPEKEIYIVGEEEDSLLFLKSMDQISDEVYHQALVIVCDTANQERISDERYKLGEKLIKIDHHPEVDTYGDISWVDTSASSVSEMIYEFYKYGEEKGLTLTTEAARLLFAGIVGDTGRFMYANTSVKTFQYAAELIEKGIDTSSLYHQLYETKENIAKLSGYVLQHYEMSDHGVASIKLTKDLLQRFQVTPNETSKFVGILGDIKGVKAWVFFIEEENQIRVRLRSKGAVINKVAQKYNGGGHPLASGATIYSWNEAKHVISDIDEVVKENE